MADGTSGEMVDAFRQSLDQYLQWLASLQHDRAKDSAVSIRAILLFCML